MQLFRQAIWGHIWKLTQEKNVQMQTMRLCSCLCRQFEETFENSFRRIGLQMQPMRLCNCSGRQFEDTFKNSLRRKLTQMGPLWIFDYYGNWIEEALEKSKWRRFLKLTFLELCFLPYFQIKADWHIIEHMQLISIKFKFQSKCWINEVSEAQKPGWQGGIAIRKVFARNPWNCTGKVYGPFGKFSDSLNIFWIVRKVSG